MFESFIELIEWGRLDDLMSAFNVMVSFMTWNCQGIKTNAAWLSTVINDYDIVALQETWLFDFESNLLKVDSDYSYMHTSGMPKDRKLIGRPYGGVGFIVKSDLMKHVKPFMTDDNRLIAITIKFGDVNLLVLNVYLPVNCQQNSALITEYIGRINSVIMQHDGPFLILGDFNISPVHSNFNELYQFCNDSQCILIDIEKLHDRTVTFISKANNGRSWVDHTIVSKNIVEKVLEVSTPFSVTPSDHIPIILKLDLSSVKLCSSETKSKKRFQWKRATDDTKNKFRYLTHQFLENLNEIPLCCESNCDSSIHKSAITNVCEHLITGLKEAEDIINDQVARRKSKQVPGWNKYVKEYYEEYRNSYLQWSNNGKISSTLYDNMVSRRRFFKIALQSVRRRKDKVLSDELAMSYNCKNFYKFWNSVKFANKTTSSSPLVVGGAEGDENICEMWADHYRSVFSRESTTTHNCDKCSKHIFRVTAADVTKCVQKLKSGKSPGLDGITAESIKYAHPVISYLISNVFNACLAHGFIPNEILRVVLVPILKRNNVDASVTKNYRPIALATVMSKIFELLIFRYHHDKLWTQPGQFGYKKGLGTETAIFTVRQLSHHYLRRNTPVYLCYLDATAAFDRVSHDKLICKLCERGFGSEAVQLMLYWFNT